MEPEILSASHDIIFKKMFTDENNTDLLKSLLSAILELPQDTIKNLRVTNPELIPENKEDKLSRLDINAEIDTNGKINLVNIEMQIADEAWFRDRAVYYWSKLFGSQLASGDKYDDLKKSISINILNYNMFKEYPEKYHFTFRMREDSLNFPLGNKDEIHFLELKKLHNEINKSSAKETWLHLLKADTKEEFNMLNNTNIPEIKKAVGVIYQMSADERMREICRVREKAILDYNSGIAAAIEKGMEEGMAKIIDEMRKIGVSEEMISLALKNIGE